MIGGNRSYRRDLIAYSHKNQGVIQYDMNNNGLEILKHMKCILNSAKEGNL